jgi:endo-1,4-beta-xylanase
MKIISRRQSGIDALCSVRRLVLSVLCVIAVQTNSASLKQNQASPKSSTLRQAADAHHILIGTAAAPRYLDEADYSALLGSEFSELEPENQMKFQMIHPRAGDDQNSFDYKPADALADFAQSHNMLLRGHTLVWHKQIPDWVKQGHYTERQLATILKNHIDSVVTHYASKVYAWDVANEAFKDDGTMRDTLWYNQPGIGAGKGTRYIEQALGWAHAADPKAKLFYNDYDAEVVNQKSDAIYAMAKDFKQRGVPLDGIGFQTHVTLQFDNPTMLSSYGANLERFAKLGLELHITELDIRLAGSSAASLTAEAKLYGEITTLCVQQPACKLVQTWGFTDKHSWIPQFYKGMGWALPWDDKYQKKPAYDAVHDALTKFVPESQANGTIRRRD